MRPLRGTRSRYVRSVSASQHSVNEHPYPACFQPIVTGSSPGVHSAGCRPPRLENRAFHDAPIASADRATFVGACSSLYQVNVPGPRDRVTEPLTPLSRTPLGAGAAHSSRCALFRPGETRRDRFDPAGVTRRNLSRSRTPSFDKRCAALPPASRPAIAHPIPGSRPPGAFGTVRPELAPGRPAWCCAPRDAVRRLFVALGSLRHA